jgi:hypothetical protein
MSEQNEVDRVKRRRGGKGKRRRRSSKPRCGVVKITRGKMAGRYRNTCTGHLTKKPRR